MTMNLRPKPKLNWEAANQAAERPAEKPRNHHSLRLPRLHPSAHAIRTVSICAALALLCVCYAGPLTQDATQVVAVKRELPVYSVDRNDDTIAISFDASWGGDNTLKLLDILDQYNVKATFFLVGIWVDKYPELVKEIAARGHEVENHSSKHPYMTKLTAEQMRTELANCSAKIQALTGKKPTLFRPPYGDYNNQVVTVTRSEGYECVQWSVDSQDWKNRGVDDLVKRATANVRSGDIVLFHNDSDYIVQALPIVLEHYRQQGLKLVPVGELLLQGPYTLDVQGKQHPAT